jgi:hypothetical protein
VLQQTNAVLFNLNKVPTTKQKYKSKLKLCCCCCFLSQIVDPKKAALVEAAEEMKLQEAKLKDARERLVKIQETIAELEEK